MGGVIYVKAIKRHLLEIKQDVEASSGVESDLKKREREKEYRTNCCNSCDFSESREDEFNTGCFGTGLVRNSF